MQRHLFDNKKTCPAVLCDIVLTDEIRQYVLDNRVYHIPKVSEKAPNKIIQVIDKSISANQCGTGPISLTVVAKCEYVYLLYVREFMIRNTPVYKVGRSTQENLKRFSQYPKGSIILLFLACKDCTATEKTLIALFCDKYEQCTEYGTEYFKGNAEDMMKDMFDTVKNIDKGPTIEPPDTDNES